MKVEGLGAAAEPPVCLPPHTAIVAELPESIVFEFATSHLLSRSVIP